jgi:tetratricopeptide (TPR) repeat protein
MKITNTAGAALGCLFAAVLLAGPTLAEIPDTFTNLKVFPQDIGKRQLMGAMRDFTTSLGVRCTFCHVQKTPGDFDSIDWASDGLEHKVTARGMMEMVRTVNGELLPKAVTGEGARVKCITCHRGLKDPRTLDEVLLQAAEKDGVDVALARYRELREEYFGSGSYDFNPGTLASVAETLAQSRGDMEGAVKVLDLGLEMNPEDLSTHVMKSQVLVILGDKEGALASAQAALKIDPENEQARKIMDQLGQ